MKRTLIFSVIIGAVIFAFAGSAQACEKGRNKLNNDGSATWQGKPRLQMMFSKLDLSDEQKAGLRAEMEKLHDAVKNGDAEQRKAAIETFRKNAHQLLTAEQKARLEQMKARMQDHIKDRQGGEKMTH